MRAAITLILTCMTSFPLMGQTEVDAGVFSSFKGFGVSARFFRPDSGEFDSINIYADTYGILSGRSSQPGVFTNYCHNYIFNEINRADYLFRMYAGAGVGFGYVHDYEPGFFDTKDVPLRNSMAFATTLACSLGLYFDFTALPLSLDLSLTANPGLFIGRNQTNGNTTVALYKNGLIHIPYPQLSILYRF